MKDKISGTFAEAMSISALRTTLQQLVLPTHATQHSELSALLSLSFSPLFTELFACDGQVSISWGEDPPDFVVTASMGRSSLEVTRFTHPQNEIFHRKRQGPGLYTSTLRANKPDKKFWANLQSGSLPDDSAVEPHTEKLSDLDADYFKTAFGVYAQKCTDLLRYNRAYDRRLLLIYDKLSEFTYDFERRIPILRRYILVQPRPHFEEVILINGNQHAGVYAVKL